MHGDLEAFPRCNKIYRRREEKKEGKKEKEKERTAKFESFGFVHRPSLDRWIDGGQGCQMAKFDPFLSLDCARVEGGGVIL